MTDPEDIDERLARLGKATAGVRPRADFNARVMAATAATPTRAGDFWLDVPRVARRLLPVAALAAALGIVWAVRTSNDVDSAFADSYETLDLEW